MKRVKLGKEPVLHVWRYIVTVGRLCRGQWKTKMKCFRSLAEVKSFREAAPKKSYIEVYEAHHNFREAWEK